MPNGKARRVAGTGMLFALAIALSWLESCVTPLLGLMPALKLGLANIVVMYALLFLDTRSAAALVALKALFALLTRGVTAGALSGCGGALSLLVLWALLRAPVSVSGYLFCVCGALAHNLGQLAGAAVMLLLYTMGLPHTQSDEKVEDVLRRVDWTTVFFFVGLFVIVGALDESGFL